VIGASTGKIGTAIAQQNLRSVLQLLQLAADELAGAIQFTSASSLTMAT
jgi:hypothetical protein